MDTQSDVSMPSKALRISKFKVRNLSYKDAKKTKIEMNYDQKSLVLQTPFLPVVEMISETSINNMCQLTTEITESSKDIKEFVKVIGQIEEHSIEHVVKNGRSLFKERDVSFIELIRENKLQNTQNIKWIFNKADVEFIDESKQSFDLKNITSDYLIKLIVEIPYLWINSTEGQFGLATMVLKGCLKPRPKPIIKTNILSSQIYDFDDSDTSQSDSDASDDMTALYVTETIKPSKKYSIHKPSKNGSEQSGVRPPPTELGSAVMMKAPPTALPVVPKPATPSSSSEDDLIPISSALRNKTGMSKMINNRYTEDTDIELIKRSSSSESDDKPARQHGPHSSRIPEQLISSSASSSSSSDNEILNDLISNGKGYSFL